MKWYKHDSNAHTDAKLCRVRLKYGMEGYGLYWYCLELIAANVEVHNLTFELEHDAELIAAATGIHYELVQEMMLYMIDLGLFEQRDGIITCMTMVKRLDQSMTSNPRMRKMIGDAKNNHDSVMINHDLVMQEEKRIEEKRGRKFAPKSFVVTEEMQQWAIKELGFLLADITRETAKFRDHEYARPIKDFGRAWKNWMRRAHGWRSVGEAPPTTTADEAAKLGMKQHPGEPDDLFKARVTEAVVMRDYAK